jgi:uncharacterized sulfatase
MYTLAPFSKPLRCTLPGTLVACIALALLSPLPLLQAAETSRAGRTNVLFLIADDLNRSLPCYGNPIVQTPNVDRLAARAVRFDRAYCQYPVCSPSRVSFLSGRRPEQTRMFGNEGSSRTPSLENAVFLPEYFRQQGYFTARVGKVFHIGRDVPECWDVTEEGTPDHQIIYQPQEPVKLGLSENIAAESQLDGDTGEGGHWYQLNVAEEKLVDPQTARRVSELIEQGVREQKPFFIACGFRRPHLPWMAPTSYFDLYPPDGLPLPVTGNVPRPGGDPKKPAASPESRRAALRGYYACISFMDRQLGKVLDTLDRHKLWENTVVVLLGDNGYHLGNRGGYWGKGTPYEDSCGVPLLIAAPGKANATGCRRVVEYVDFYPTLVDLCGLPERGDLEGRSLRTLLENPAAPWDHAAFTITARNGQPSSLAVSTERFRYIEYADARKPAELYDIQADPREWNNLAESSEHAETLAKMKKSAAEHKEKFWK